MITTMMSPPHHRGERVGVHLGLGGLLTGYCFNQEARRSHRRAQRPGTEGGGHVPQSVGHLAMGRRRAANDRHAQPRHVASHCPGRERTDELGGRRSLARQGLSALRGLRCGYGYRFREGWGRLLSGAPVAGLPSCAVREDRSAGGADEVPDGPLRAGRRHRPVPRGEEGSGEDFERRIRSEGIAG
jgi:hypothetical protein